MAADLLISGVEITLALTFGLLAVILLRRPVRALFGARAAYGLWLPVPAVVVAVALPGPAASPPPARPEAAVAPAAAPADAAADAPAAPAAPQPAAAPSAVRFAIEGEHYDLIPGGQPFEPLNGKIEVIEVFNYVCPACASFQTLVNGWKTSLPADVRFTYVPAPFGGNWDPYVRAYYTAEAMGIVDRTHDAIFKAIHLDRSLKGERGTDSVQEIAAVYAQSGADPAQFASTMASFTVNAKFGRAKQYIADHRINQTPTVLVNGRYRVKGRSWQELLQNTDRVVAQVRAGG